MTRTAASAPPSDAPREGARGPLNRSVLVLGLLAAVPLLALLLLNLGRNPHAIDSPLVGRAAPGFALRPVDGGEPVALSALRGQVVVVNFWATWCVPCFEEHPLLASAARGLEGRARFLGVVYEDDPAQVQRFLARHGSAYPSLLDPDSRTAIAYGVFGVPETYFIDAEGRIAAKHVGPLEPGSLATKLRQAGVAP
jgi:cytochrome c biogenesis protein CcmG/thiol:disulfide interchange protein DsbE